MTQYHFLGLSTGLLYEFSQSDQKFRFALEGLAHLKRIGGKVEKIHLVQSGVGDFGKPDVASEIGGCGVQKGAFPGAGLADYHDEPLALQNAVLENGERLFMF